MAADNSQQASLFYFTEKEQKLSLLVRKTHSFFNWNMFYIMRVFTFISLMHSQKER